jgi:hypothetical protein
VETLRSHLTSLRGRSPDPPAAKKLLELHEFADSLEYCVRDSAENDLIISDARTIAVFLDSKNMKSVADQNTHELADAFATIAEAYERE